VSPWPRPEPAIGTLAGRVEPDDVEAHRMTRSQIGTAVRTAPRAGVTRELAVVDDSGVGDRSNDVRPEGDALAYVQDLVLRQADTQRLLMRASVSGVSAAPISSGA
jgi:hypothetical protein